MILISGPELWALNRRTDIGLTESLHELAIPDRGAEFDEVALLGLICRGPATTGDNEEIILHPLFSQALEQLAVATAEFATLVVADDRVGGRRYFSLDMGGFMTIERGASEIISIQLVESERPIAEYVAEAACSAFVQPGTSAREVLVGRSGAGEEAPLVGIRSDDAGDVWLEPSGESVDPDGDPRGFVDQMKASMSALSEAS